MERDKIREIIKEEISDCIEDTTCECIRCTAIQALLYREQKLTKKCERMEKENEHLKKRIEEIIGNNGDLSKE